MSNLHIEDFDVNVSYDAISPTMLWEARFQEFERVQESHQIYDAMTDDQREALIERVRRATAIMYDTAEEWIPDSLSIHDDGACLRLEFNLVFTNIDVDVDNKHKATTFKLREMREEIEKLINEFDDET